VRWSRSPASRLGRCDGPIDITTRLALSAGLVIRTDRTSSEWSPVVLTSTVADSDVGPPAAPAVMVRLAAAVAVAIAARRHRRLSRLGRGTSGECCGQRERAALGIPADRPPSAGMDHRATELDDALERRRQVGDREIGERGGVARARPTLVDPEAKPVMLDLPPRTGLGGSRLELDAQHSLPETASARGIVCRELDQRGGHVDKYVAVISRWPPPRRSIH
jgi:hypothetical protein